MAEIAVTFLVENFKEFAVDQINQLIRGKDVVRWVEDELETLIPQLQRIEDARGVSEETEDLRDVIRRAEDLSETYTKREIQRDAAAFKSPIYTIRVWSISKQLHRIKRKMADRRPSVEQLRDDVRHRRNNEVNSPGIHSAAEQHQHQTIPSHLRRCIHYLLLFPPDFKVPARRLIALWVAEGLVHTNKYTNHSVEQIAERYLKELVAQKVISFEEGKGSGKAKAYWIDVGRRADLLEDAENVNFFQHGNGKILRLADCNGSEGNSFIQIPFISKPLRDYRDVISFLSFNTEEGSKPGEDIGNFLRKCILARCFIWLRVLDLERVFRPQLPSTLGTLIGLKYLGLRWTYLEHLPGSVEKLFNLQVLDVKHTYISILPRSIWRMQYLRHLYLSEAYRTRFPLPPSRITINALQSLWGAFVDEDTCVINGLNTLVNIRKLGLSCRSRSSKLDDMTKQLQAIDKWISKLEFLESLRLKSRDESGDAVDLHLTSLAGNRKLSTVYLLGRLDRHGLILCKLPGSLTNITLSGSALDLDPMPYLGRLPNLVILRLLAKSVVWKNMYCPRRGFRSLEFLGIWKLETLEEFEAEEGSLSCLKKLEIRSCNKLGKLPDRLYELEDLEIKLTNMPPEFVQKTQGKYDKISEQNEGEYHQYTLKPRTRFTRETKGKFAVVA